MVQLNEIATDAAGTAQPPGFDSAHGVWPVDGKAEDGTMRVGEARIACSSNAAVAAASEGGLPGIPGHEERPLVSLDYLNDPRSAVINARSTMVIDGAQVKVYARSDNAWGCVNRMMDIVARLAARP